MWFGYDNENSWHPLEVHRVNAILKMNRSGKKPATLHEDRLEDPKDSVLNEDLAQMDKKYSSKHKKKKKKKRRNKNRSKGSFGNDQKSNQKA